MIKLISVAMEICIMSIKNMTKTVTNCGGLLIFYKNINSMTDCVAMDTRDTNNKSDLCCYGDLYQGHQ